MDIKLKNKKMKNNRTWKDPVQEIIERPVMIKDNMFTTMTGVAIERCEHRMDGR